MVIFSFAAAVLTTLSFVPQAVQVIKTKDTRSISLVMYIMFTLGVLFWLIYGLAISDVTLIAANAVTFIFAVIILSYKIINVRNGKDK